MLLILTSAVTNRLAYIFELLLKDLLGIDYRITQSGEEFKAYDGPRMVYGREPFGETPFVAAAELLFETAVYRQDWGLGRHQGLPLLFRTSHTTSVLPFDPFAAAFFMVTRYEEYLTHKKDKFGRFPAKASIAWEANFLEIPVVHRWAGMLEETLKSRYPSLKTTSPEYKFTPTIDIDHAWSYLGRSLGRTLGGFSRSLLHGRFNEIGRRIRVLSRIMADPFDSYDYINSLHDRYGQIPLYFILFADYGKSDNNVTIKSKEFQHLLRKLDRRRNVGIHPSLSSNKHIEKFENEYHGLCNVLGRKVTISRQHFLKIAVPRTYRVLVQMGISHDYSMGYAGNPGFRAGMARPFRFFDLPTNDVTSLTVHPVSIMDVTLRDYLRLNVSESISMITDLIAVTRSVNGEFVSLWHNESLGNTGRWKGWRAVYEEMVRHASA